MLTGIQVNDVELGGPGQIAGIQRGDIIVAIEGSPIINDESLSSLISSSRPGEVISVRVWRGDELINLDVTLGKMRDEVLARRILQPIQIQMGMFLQGNEDRRLEVRQIWNGLPGAEAGFKFGDVIERINGKDYDGYFSFFVMLADEGILTGETIEFAVRSRGEDETRTIPLRLFW